MKEGRPTRFDYEYQRNGVANLFMMFAPLEGWRHVKVTDRHTAIDYAHALKDLAETHFPKAKKIVLVQDNLNTHKPASLYEAFPAAAARRLTERFEWHYTPTRQLARPPPNPNSAFSRRNASTAAFLTLPRSSRRSPRGKPIETNTTPKQIGNSLPTTRASNSSIYTLRSS